MVKFRLLSLETRRRTVQSNLPGLRPYFLLPTCSRHPSMLYIIDHTTYACPFQQFVNLGDRLYGIR